ECPGRPGRPVRPAGGRHPHPRPGGTRLHRPGARRRPRRAAGGHRRRGAGGDLRVHGGRDLPDRRQLRQSDQPGRGDHRAGDGPGLRPAAGRDRPLRRLHRRRRRRHPRRHTDPAWLGMAARAARHAGGRRGDRLRDLHPRGPARHSELRGHPGVLPRPAGRDAADHRRGRHDPHPRGRDPLGDEQQHAGGARLAVRPDRRRRLRRREPVGHPHEAQGGTAGRGDVGLGRQGRGSRRAGLHRRVPAQPGAPARDGHHHHPGSPVGGPAGRGAGLRPRLPARAHAVRTPRVRRRRQRRGRPARRHQRRADQDDLLRAGLDPGDRGRHPARLARQLGLPDDGRRADAALRRRRRGDRRHQPVRRTGPHLRRGHRRPRGRGHRQRAPARHAAVGNPVHHQRHRAPRGGERRCHLPPASGGNRQM
ncbi:MAG: Xylose ABC transporter, permease protein XylH, partial [uncultured Solirubrobacteraceae bacterium]